MNKTLILSSSLIALTVLAVSTAPANAQPKKKTVTTTFTILADMARNVAGDQLTVTSITKQGAEIHGYQPTPSDIVKAQQADLVLYNGFNLERWFEKFLGQLKKVPTVILTSGVTPMNIADAEYKGKPNPHAWMSPKNALIYVENIRKAFVKLEPASAATFNDDGVTALYQHLRAELADAGLEVAIPEHHGVRRAAAVGRLHGALHAAVPVGEVG